jgi:hypothetical protein
MRLQRLRWIASGLVTALLLVACVRSRAVEAVPAVFDAPSTTNREALQSALRSVLGQSVLVADDALTHEAQLIIGPTPARIDGKLLDGRDNRPAEKFALVLEGKHCVLLRASNGQRIALKGARCRAIKP